jgi:hypothetical protein
MGSPIQNLDRVNDLVNSARAMADSLRTQSNAMPNQGFANPFSVSPMAHGATGIQASNGTGVEVGQHNIRINAGGREFNIPRIGTNSVVSPSVNGSGLPNLRANEAVREAAYFVTFADSVRAFHQADFVTATKKVEEASLARNHQFQEFHSLCCFAQGDYKSAAELAYGWAATRPVSGWNQVRSFYNDRQVYAKQYLALQDTVRNAATKDTSTMFLLGYHHLMLGHREHAAMVFNEVLVELPNDPVVANLLKECEMGPPTPVVHR